MDEIDNDVKRKHRMLVFCAALGGFLFGYDTAVVNGALFQLKTDFGFDLNSWQAGLIVSIAIIGAFMGSIFAGYAGSAFGRRQCILVADVLFALGSIILCIAPIIEIVYVGRFILGLGIGLSSVVVPVYLAELSSAASRGQVVATNTFVLTGAQCVAAGLSALMIATTSSSVGWRILFGIGAVPAIAQLVAIKLFLPETPRWLTMKGRVGEAQQVEVEFGLEPAAEEEDEDVHGQSSLIDGEAGKKSPSSRDSSTATGEIAYGRMGQEQNEGKGWMVEVEIVKSLFTVKSHRQRLLVGVGLQAFQQLVGINTIMYYSGTILKDCGFQGDKSPVYWSVPLAATNALFTILGIFKVDSMGRRKVMLASLAGCLLTTSIMSLIGFVARKPGGSSTATGGGNESWSSSSSIGGSPATTAAPDSSVYSETTGYIFLFVLFCYLASFAPGMGIVPWIVNSEIYPTKLRTASASVATMANWGSNAVVSQLFPIMMGSSLGVGGTFLVVVACVVCAIIFLYIKVPETKGKTLEEINSMFQSHGDLDTHGHTERTTM